MQAEKERAGHSRRLIFHTFSNLGPAPLAFCLGARQRAATRQYRGFTAKENAKVCASRSGFLGMGGILECLVQRNSTLLSNVCGAILDSAPQPLVRAHISLHANSRSRAATQPRRWY